MPKVTGNSRLNIVRHLNNPYSLNNNRNQSSSFDARKVLTRQESQTKEGGNVVVVTGLRDMKLKDGRIVSKTTSGNVEADKKKAVFSHGQSTFVTIRNNNNNVNQTNDKFSFTKTITNTSAHMEDNDRRSQTASALSSISDQKVVISFANDKYQKTSTPPSTIIKRSHDASIQTISSSVTTRSPIRLNTHRRQSSMMTDDDDDADDYPSGRTIADELDEPPVKRTTSFLRKTTTDRDEQTTSANSIKRTTTGAPISSRISSSVTAVTKKPVTSPVVSTSGTILVTNLQPSVTEDDVVELFGKVGQISEIKTLSQGCVQITYAKREHSEHAASKYHNRLLDGQFMYVSLQQSSVSTEKSKPTSKITSTKETGTTSASASATANQPLKFNANPSTKSTLDPAFVRQALFHPSNNSNPVQFQVKL